MDSTRSTLIAAMVIVAACSPPVSTTSAPTKTDFLRANIDTTVDPARAFFQYANGGRLRHELMPHADGGGGGRKAAAGRGYRDLHRLNQQGVAECPGAGQRP